MKAWLVAAAVILAPGAALACDGWWQAYEIDPEEVGVDTQPPGPTRVLGVDVRRAVQPLLPDRLGNSCAGSADGSSDAGEVFLRVEPSTDDRTAREQIGYRVELFGDRQPWGMRGQSWIEILGHGDTIAFTWEDRDEDELLDFTVRITPLDRAGNEGPAAEVHVRDEGAGCAAASGGAGLLGPAGVLAGLLRRRRRAMRVDRVRPLA